MALRRISKQFRVALNFRGYAQGQFQDNTKPLPEFTIDLPEIEYDLEFLCNPSNRDTIYSNIQKRKRDGDIDKVIELSRTPNSRVSLLNELKKIPNLTDPEVLELTEPKVIRESGVRPTFNFKPLDLHQIAKKSSIMRIDQLGPVAGQRAYAFIGDLADLEQALINYSMEKLIKRGFKFVSVPDILPTEIIQRCGLVMDNERTLVYELEDGYGEHLSLSGTAEMALAYMLMNKKFSKEQLPLKLAAVSRCFRAEVSSLSKERGLYRVHQFTKVEMFACCDQEESFSFLHELVKIQEELFEDLELWFKVLEMPPHELGSPAYKKIDIEAWMPGKQTFGELTSCSNCTDYQSRRLNIKYETADGKLLHVHTLNGTACAVPRTIIAIAEKYQQQNGHIAVPEVLIPYMNGKKEITGKGIPASRSHKYNPRSQSS